MCVESKTRRSFIDEGSGCASRRALGITIAALLATVGAAKADVIADFNAIGARTVAPTGVPAPGYPAVTDEEKRTVSWVDLATMHLAMYDAVVAIEGKYQPYAVTPLSPAAGASSSAAAGAAACAVLQGLFPNRSPQYSADCASYQPGAGADDATNKGITLGIEVGTAMLAERAGDGRSSLENYVPGGGTGDYVPPVPGNPALHFAPYMRPFAVGSLQQFRADGPPDLTSATYAQDFAEVKEFGVAGGAQLSADQQDAARFHTDNPNLFWPRGTRVFMNKPSVLENARLAAMLQTSMADAIVGCFDSKYYFDAWRPRTAIPAAGADGNPATTDDPAWMPFLATPNHPEYPSGHTCIAGAVAEVVKFYNKTPKVAFTWTSPVTGTARSYASVHEMVREIKDARVWGGMHFRFANEDGATLGRRTAQWVVRNYFQPVGKK
jgi:hypothetical protein